MKTEIDKLKILSEVCDEYGVSFSGPESNAILRFAESYAKERAGSLMKFIIPEYNEWLLEYGYVDFDIISEFEYSDFQHNFDTWYDTFINK